MCTHAHAHTRSRSRSRSKPCSPSRRMRRRAVWSASWRQARPPRTQPSLSADLHRMDIASRHTAQELSAARRTRSHAEALQRRLALLVAPNAHLPAQAHSSLRVQAPPCGLWKRSRIRRRKRRHWAGCSGRRLRAWGCRGGRYLAILVHQGYQRTLERALVCPAPCATTWPSRNIFHTHEQTTQNRRKETKREAYEEPHKLAHCTAWVNTIDVG
jgi:hypothetical protein